MAENRCLDVVADMISVPVMSMNRIGHTGVVIVKAKTRVLQRNMNKKKTNKFDEQRYPGVAVDAADSDIVTPKMERDYTRSLNNNPRNSGD
ncbi:MAG: hypothetical protein K2L71_03695 [Muribaculaceae bacterium]|nr:hypothetical protein [Muribaculaceae bacterium]